MFSVLGTLEGWLPILGIQGGSLKDHYQGFDVPKRLLCSFTY